MFKRKTKSSAAAAVAPPAASAPEPAAELRQQLEEAERSVAHLVAELAQAQTDYEAAREAGNAATTRRLAALLQELAGKIADAQIRFHQLDSRLAEVLSVEATREIARKRAAVEEARRQLRAAEAELRVAIQINDGFGHRIRAAEAHIQQLAARRRQLAESPETEA